MKIVVIGSAQGQQENKFRRFKINIVMNYQKKLET